MPTLRDYEVTSQELIGFYKLSQEIVMKDQPEADRQEQEIYRFLPTTNRVLPLGIRDWEQKKIYTSLTTGTLQARLKGNWLSLTSTSSGLIAFSPSHDTDGRSIPVNVFSRIGNSFIWTVEHGVGPIPDNPQDLDGWDVFSTPVGQIFIDVQTREIYREIDGWVDRVTGDTSLISPFDPGASLFYGEVEETEPVIYPPGLSEIIRTPQEYVAVKLTFESNKSTLDLDEYNRIDTAIKSFEEVGPWEDTTKPIYLLDRTGRLELDEIGNPIPNPSRIVQAPMRGELNRYYRHLFIQYRISPVTSRTADNFQIIYNPTAVDGISGHQIQWYLEEHAKFCRVFRATFYNQSYSRGSLYQAWCSLFICWAVSIRAMNIKLSKLSRIDELSQRDLNNILYSNGLFEFDNLPLGYKRRFIKALNELLAQKGTLNVFKLILALFNLSNEFKIYEFFLVKRFPYRSQRYEFTKTQLDKLKADDRNFILQINPSGLNQSSFSLFSSSGNLDRNNLTSEQYANILLDDFIRRLNLREDVIKSARRDLPVERGVETSYTLRIIFNRDFTGTYKFGITKPGLFAFSDENEDESDLVINNDLDDATLDDEKKKARRDKENQINQDYSQIEMEFVRVPVDSDTGPQEYHIREDYDNFIVDDPTWKATKLELEEKDFVQTRTKYLSVTTSLDIIQSSMATAFLWNALKRSEIQRPSLRLSFPGIPVEGITILEAMVGLLIITLNQSGAEDIIPHGQSGVATVLGIRQNLRGSNLFPYPATNYNTIPQNFTAEDVTSVLSKNIDNIRVINREISSIQNKKEWDDLYRSRLEQYVEEYQSSVFGSHSTYSSWLNDRNPFFYQWIESLEDELNLNEAILALSSGIEEIVTREDVNLKINLGGSDLVLSYLKQMLDYFKSYTVQFKELGVEYFIGERTTTTAWAVDDVESVEAKIQAVSRFEREFTKAEREIVDKAFLNKERIPNITRDAEGNHIEEIDDYTIDDNLISRTQALSEDKFEDIDDLISVFPSIKVGESLNEKRDINKVFYFRTEGLEDGATPSPLIELRDRRGSISIDGIKYSEWEEFHDRPIWEGLKWDYNSGLIDKDEICLSDGFRITRQGDLRQ